MFLPRCNYGKIINGQKKSLFLTVRFVLFYYNLIF